MQEINSCFDEFITSSMFSIPFEQNLEISEIIEIAKEEWKNRYIKEIKEIEELANKARMEYLERDDLHEKEYELLKSRIKKIEQQKMKIDNDYLDKKKEAAFIQKEVLDNFSSLESLLQDNEKELKNLKEELKNNEDCMLQVKKVEVVAAIKRRLLYEESKTENKKYQEIRKDTRLKLNHLKDVLEDYDEIFTFLIKNKAKQKRYKDLVLNLSDPKKTRKTRALEKERLEKLVDEFLKLGIDFKGSTKSMQKSQIDLSLILYVLEVAPGKSAREIREEIQEDLNKKKLRQNLREKINNLKNEILVRTVIQVERIIMPQRLELQKLNLVNKEDRRYSRNETILENQVLGSEPKSPEVKDFIKQKIQSTFFKKSCIYGDKVRLLPEVDEGMARISGKKLFIKNDEIYYIKTPRFRNIEVGRTFDTI